MNPWSPTTSAQVKTAVRAHYSHRGRRAVGHRLGGIGSRKLFATERGSVFIATLQRTAHMRPKCVPLVRWYNTVFIRKPDEPRTASELITAAVQLLHAINPAPVTTIINPRQVRGNPPGNCYRRAGFVLAGTTRKGDPVLTRTHTVA